MFEAKPVRNAAATATPLGRQDRDTTAATPPGPHPRTNANPLHASAVSLTVRTQRPAWHVPPLSWIVPLRPTRTFHLDRLGTQVWRLCDGERTVEQVVEAFAQRHRLTFHEARVAVAGYLGSLVQRGALAIVMPEKETAGETTRAEE